MRESTRRRLGLTLTLLTLVTTSGCASLGWLGLGDRGRDEWSWEERMQAAERFHRTGDRERALVGYLRAWQQAPERPLSRIRIAQLQLEDDPARAVDGFRRIVSQHPEEVRAWTGLGVAALAEGRFEEARAAFGEAVARAPDSALARAGEATALDLLGRPDEAQAALDRAQAEHPEDLWLINNVAVSRLVARDFAGAEAALRTVLVADPDDRTARNNLGLALGGQERYADAYQAFLAAGDEQAARNNLGYVLFLNGHYADAVKEYERALASEGEATRSVLANLNRALDAISDGGRGRR